MKVCLTIDMEQDCPPYLTSYRGIEEGAPLLLQLLREEKVSATFFATGDVARRYPDLVRTIVENGHELGCHGDTHRRFDAMEQGEAKEEIQKATKVLRNFYPVRSFRAPNLQFPEKYLTLLEEEGYALDSSQGKHKWPFFMKRQSGLKLQRIPASTTSSTLRLPKPLRWMFLKPLKTPVVLFVHPWEFVDFTQSSLRWDCRFKTGRAALQCLRETIGFFKKKGEAFVRMEDLLE